MREGCGMKPEISLSESRRASPPFFLCEFNRFHSLPRDRFRSLDLVFRGLQKPAILLAISDSCSPFNFSPRLRPFISFSLIPLYAAFSFYFLTLRSNLKRCIVANPFSLHALAAPE